MPHEVNNLGHDALLLVLLHRGIPKVDSNTSSLPKVDSSVLTQIVIVVLRSKIDSDYGPRN